MREVTVAATQMACSEDSRANIDKAKDLIRKCSSEGAQIILIQELFESVYFPCLNDPKNFELAKPFNNNPLLNEMSELAKELGVVLPMSFFEQDNNTYYNSLAMIDADGKILDIYRKSHIPDGPGYEEKYYFHPGNTGFKVFNTAFGKIGIGICWDQWFPEAARIMALKGAEILFYPTAIGDELMSEYDSSGAWQRVMQGHAAANIMPVVASNRIGSESVKGQVNGFYGKSFICDRSGKIIKEASKDKEEIILADIDTEENHLFRRNWGLFRDRRTDLYKEILTLEGKIKD